MPDRDHRLERMDTLVLAERAAGEDVIFLHRADLDLQQEIIVAGHVPRGGDFGMADDLAREIVHRLRPGLFHPDEHVHGERRAGERGIR